jgi:putative phosphoesterase
LNRIVIAIISDTHGLLRREAISCIKGSDYIIHAGDVGSPEVIEELKLMAQVFVVRGNVDREEWAKQLPYSETISLGDKKIHVLHDIKMLDIKPEDLGIQVVISGHSHKPSEEIKSGVIYLNPGSIGSRRFKLPIAMAKLTIEDSRISTSFIYL